MRKYCTQCRMEVEFIEYSDNQCIVLQEHSHAVLWGNSHAEFRGNSHAVLWGNSHAGLWEDSHAVLRENSHALLLENSHAVLWGNSHAELRGNSHAVLRENSHAVLLENSHAVLWGNSHAVLRENSHAQCKSPYAYAVLKSTMSKCTGRHIGDMPLTPKEYLSYCGVEIKNQFVILYKSVKSDFSSYFTNNVKYIIGKEIVAPDWDKDAIAECGEGLHLSPTIQQARSFNDGELYLACRVKLSDIANLPAYAQYPDKIRVRACVPLYQVDKEGNKI